MTPILVIGYGNELLGDDAAGPRTAAAVALQNWAEVRTLSLPQLTPELAELVAQSRHVLFIDTTADPAQRSVQLRPVEPAAPSGGIGQEGGLRWVFPCHAAVLAPGNPTMHGFLAGGCPASTKARMSPLASSTVIPPRADSI